MSDKMDNARTRPAETPKNEENVLKSDTNVERKVAVASFVHSHHHARFNPAVHFRPLTLRSPKNTDEFSRKALFLPAIGRPIGGVLNASRNTRQQQHTRRMSTPEGNEVIDHALSKDITTPIQAEYGKADPTLFSSKRSVCGVKRLYNGRNMVLPHVTPRSSTLTRHLGIHESEGHQEHNAISYEPSLLWGVSLLKPFVFEMNEFLQPKATTLSTNRNGHNLRKRGKPTFL
jgi:hypothetical protein